jgi:hypothetical protein
MYNFVNDLFIFLEFFFFLPHHIQNGKNPPIIVCENAPKYFHVARFQTCAVYTVRLIPARACAIKHPPKLWQKCEVEKLVKF